MQNQSIWYDEQASKQLLETHTHPSFKYEDLCRLNPKSKAPRKMLGEKVIEIPSLAMPCFSN
jgi:hypothetical protein